MNPDKLKGVAVIAQDEGARLGRVVGTLFERATLQLRALQVKGDGQGFIVPFDQVRTIGVDAIMVGSSQDSQAASNAGEFGQLIDLNAIKKLKVVDSTGSFTGTVHDLDLDATTGKTLRLIVHKGGLLGLGGETTTIDAATIAGIGPELITVVVTAETPPPPTSPQA